MNNEITNSIEYWNNIHKEYNIDDIKYDDWLNKFNDIINECNTPILDLGCGSGNNTLYLTKLGKEVIACDIAQNSIDNIKKNFPNIYDAKCFNMLDGLPFDDNSFGIVIADLSLHYFKKDDTEKVISDIKRVLNSNGYLIIRVNSMNDVNHGAGQGNIIEEHLYETKDGRFKRFFDEEDIRYYFRDFDIVYLNEEIMTRYQLEKRLYRVCLRNK